VLRMPEFNQMQMQRKIMKEESKENKDNLVALRLNNEQMLAVKQWAHQHNANVSQVIRSAIELMTGAKQ
jgi:predicted DNA binding CopG/RHH family protein